MRKIFPAFVVLALLVAGAGARGQAPAGPPASSSSSSGQAPAAAAAAPTLSEMDRLKLTNALQGIELWTLKVQAAAGELQKARADADKLIAALQVPGWVLTDQLEYVKAPAKSGGGGR